MTIQYRIDLSRYTDNQVAMLMVNNVISREEFEQWRSEKKQAMHSSNVRISEVPMAVEKAFESK